MRTRLNRWSWVVGDMHLGGTSARILDANGFAGRDLLELEIQQHPLRAGNGREIDLLNHRIGIVNARGFEIGTLQISFEMKPGVVGLAAGDFNSRRRAIGNRRGRFARWRFDDAGAWFATSSLRHRAARCGYFALNRG